MNSNTILREMCLSKYPTEFYKIQKWGKTEFLSIFYLSF